MVVAKDGQPDETPGKVSNNWQAPVGNHVVFETEHGTFLILAHLQKGSVAVEAGQEVAEGTFIGRCGNSGNTSGPHLHHQKQDPCTFPVGFAEGLQLSFRDNEGPSEPKGGVEMVDGKLRWTGDTIRHRTSAAETGSGPD